MKYNFVLATIEDIDAIAEIEATHFKGDSLETTPYSREDLHGWYQRNNKMFYVVKTISTDGENSEENSEVGAYVIFMPVTDLCYDRLRKDEINDPREFDACDILSGDIPDDDIQYYYTASIAINPKFSKQAGISVSLIKGIANFFKDRGTAVITTPVTEEGLRLTQRMNYVPVVGNGGLNTIMSLIYKK